MAEAMDRPFLIMGSSRESVAARSRRHTASPLCRAEIPPGGCRQGCSSGTTTKPIWSINLKYTSGQMPNTARMPPVRS